MNRRSSKDSEENWTHLKTNKKFDLGLSGTGGQTKTELSRVTSGNSNSIFVESLIEQLCHLLQKDPRQQKRVYLAICAKLRELRLIGDSYTTDELSGLRAHYGHAITSCLSNSEIRSPFSETSRYLTEFIELEFIAAGGFGEVYRARHRLDQVEYAVKKVKFRYKNVPLFLRTLSEVKTLARLNHMNIVQYKAAWLEACPIPLSKNAQQYEYDEQIAVSDCSDIVFQNESDDEENNEPDNALQPFRRTISPFEMGVVLYVTMQLCDETLRQWLDRRNSNLTSVIVDSNEVTQIMKQIAAGLEYIHSCNIVHHDIKPSNIFVNRKLRVQVGDFGLACYLQGSNHHRPAQQTDDTNVCPLRAGQRGTQLYAAPEQLHGHCSAKADIFSLGLVFVELLVPFKTDMERVKELTQARAGMIPHTAHLQRDWLTLEPLLMSMLSRDPSTRPSARKLTSKLNFLDSPAGGDSEDTINELRRQLAMRDLEIQRLKEQYGATLSDNLE